jgi:hypothetical protein
MPLPRGGRGPHGRTVQVDPIKTTLKAPGNKLLRLKYDKPLSNFAFKFNLRRYIKDLDVGSNRLRQGLPDIPLNPDP